MISKEYAADFIIKSNMHNRLKARSLDFAEMMHIDAEELDRAIDALSSARTLTSLTTNTLRELRERKQKIDRISSASPLVILGFEEVHDGAIDLLLPILYDEKLNYGGLEASLLSHCRRALGRDATQKVYGYKGLLDINATANSATAGETLDALYGLPSEFETARVYFNLVANVQPGNAIVPMGRPKTTKPHKRGEGRSRVLEYVSTHGGITVRQAQELMGNSEGAAYQVLNGLRNEKLLDKVGQEYRTPGATHTAPAVDHQEESGSQKARRMEHDADVVGYRGAGRLFEYLKKRGNGSAITDIYFDASEIQRESRESGTLRFLTQHQLVEKGTGAHYGKFRFTSKGVAELSE